MKEEVNHPERYGGDTVYECIKVLEAWLPPEQYRNLKKAEWYLNKLIEKEVQESEGKRS